MENKDKIDCCFLIPNNSKKSYQKLSETYSAIEPPTWALLLASSVRKNKFSCEILDCDALRLNEEESVKENILEDNNRKNIVEKTTNIEGITKE